MNVRTPIWLLLVALVVAGAGRVRGATEPVVTPPPWPNFDAPEFKATFVAYVRTQIEDEARLGNYTEHQRERTSAFSAEYMVAAARLMFLETAPGIRRQLAAYRAELTGYLVIVLQSSPSVEDRRLRTMAAPAEDVGAALYQAYEQGLTLSVEALQAAAELVLPMHRDPVWQAAVAEKRYPAVALREFISSRERHWNAWEAAHPQLEPAVFQAFKAWFNEKTAGDLDYMEKVHRGR